MKPKTQKFLERAMVVSIIVLNVNYIFNQIMYKLGILKDIFESDFSIYTITIITVYTVNYTAVVFTIIGIFQLASKGKLELLPIFKFPIFLRFIGSINWFLISLISPEYDFIAPLENNNYYFLGLQFVNLFFIICTLVFYSLKKAPISFEDSKPVKKSSRFLDYFIDLIIIYFYILSNIFALQTSFDADFSSDDSSAITYVVVFGYMFVYYLISESLFLQTIGKLHNDSYVAYTGNRFLAIMVRTLSRFIPFDSLSFFGQVGWHDSISGTTVTKIQKSTSDEIDEIGIKEN